MARERWLRLVRKNRDDDQQRPWFLLAAQHARSLAPQVPRDGDEKEKRLELVRKKLEQAAGLAADGPGEAQVIYQDIIALYARDPDLDALTGQARKHLEKLAGAKQP